MAYPRRAYESPLLSKTWVFLQTAHCFKMSFPCARRGSGGGGEVSTDPSWWWGSQDASRWYRWGRELWGQMPGTDSLPGPPCGWFYLLCVCCLCCFECCRRLFWISAFLTAIPNLFFLVPSKQALSCQLLFLPPALPLAVWLAPLFFPDPSLSSFPVSFLTTFLQPASLALVSLSTTWSFP